MRKILEAQAKIRRLSAGGGTPSGSGLAGVGAGTPVKDLVERLAVLTACREQMALRTRIAQIEAGMETETERLDQQIREMEARLNEPLRLEITAPVAAQEVTRGTALGIRWDSGGPIGGRVRIDLLKAGTHFIFMKEVLTGAGHFEWSVPVGLLLGEDYQITVQDPTTGLSAMSGHFKVV